MGILHRCCAARAGTPAAPDPVAGAVADCGEAWFALPAALTHTFTWTAPTTEGCVTLSAAQSINFTDAFNIATVRRTPPSTPNFVA